MIWPLLIQLVIYTALVGAMAVLQPVALGHSPFAPVPLFVFMWAVCYWPSVIAVAMLRYANRISAGRAMRLMIANEAVLLLLAQICLSLADDWPFYIAFLLEILAVFVVLATTRMK